MLMAVDSRRTILELVDALAHFAERLGLRGAEVERLIGLHGGVWPMSRGAKSLWWPTDEQAERIAALCEVCASVAWLVGPEASEWTRRRNAGLGCSPIGFMLRGRGSVLWLRDALRQEQGQC